MTQTKHPPRQAIALSYDGQHAPTLTAKGDDQLAEAILPALMDAYSSMVQGLKRRFYSRVTRYGDLAIGEKIMPPEMTRPTPKVETVMTPPLPPDVPYVITQPKPWWRRLLNLFLAEKP